jgi:hypothetical protein
MVAWPLPPTALTEVGAPGTATGTTELVALDTELVPIAFVAVTVKLYVVPFERPVIVTGEAPPYTTKPPVLDETV